MDYIKSELDELMGKDRNIPLKERQKQREYYDMPEVCKFNLVTKCPHDLFPNTKYDQQKCTKRHDKIFKKQFDEDEKRIPNEKRYINEALDYIEMLLSNVDTKIKRAIQKQDAPPQQQEKPKEVLDKMDQYDLEIKMLLTKVEVLGDQGKLEEIDAVMAEVEKFKKMKEELNSLGDNPLVCEICGAMQAVNDTEKRLQTHLEGKLHTGFDILRKEFVNLKQRREEIKNQTYNKVKKRSKSRSRSKDRKRDKDRDRSKDRDRDRKKDKKDRDRKRSKSRSKSKSRKDRKHSKDRDRDRKDRDKKDKRSKSRDKKKRSKSRSKSKNKSKKHKSKKESKEKKIENGTNENSTNNITENKDANKINTETEQNKN